jgi:diguanylate cyclase (GGDEF)-like protein
MAAAVPVRERRVPLALAGLLLGLTAVALAALAAWSLAELAGAPPSLAAALAAALGMVVVAVPVALLLLRVAPRAVAGEGALAGPMSAVGVARPLFMELAQREWARARRYGSGAAMLLVEVDRHARLAEARGPAAVAAVLAELQQQIAPTLRPADLLTRFSDTQMAVFLAHADATGALDVAERIRERAEQLEVPGPAPASAAGPAVPLRVTVSVGVAHLRPAHLHLHALVDDAEDAVAAARQAGGNCVRAAPVDATRTRAAGGWRGDERRSRPTQPKQGGKS